MGSEPQFSKFPNLSLSQTIFRASNPRTPHNDLPSHRQTLQNAIEKDSMAPLYHFLCGPPDNEPSTLSTPLARTHSKSRPSSLLLDPRSIGLTYSPDLYAKLKSANDTELAAINKELAEASEAAGDQEVSTAKGKLCDFYARTGAKDLAIESYEALLVTNPALGTRIDIMLAITRIALFFGDTPLVKKTIDRAKTLVESGGDWDRRNRLKAYQGLYYLLVRDYALAAPLLLDSLSTFTSYELCTYSEIVVYAVIAGAVALPRTEFKKRVVDAPEVKAIVGQEDTRLVALSGGDTEMTDTPPPPSTSGGAVNVTALGSTGELSEATESGMDFSPIVKLVTSFYHADYARFFVGLAEVEERFLTQDRFLYEHRQYWIREMRLRGYQQFLQSYRVVGLENMARSFGVTVDYLDRDLAKFVAAGRISATIDRVNGLIETNRPDDKNKQYAEVIRCGDALITKLQKYGQAVRLRGSERA